MKILHKDRPVDRVDQPSMKYSGLSGLILHVALSLAPTALGTVV